MDIKWEHIINMIELYVDQEVDKIDVPGTVLEDRLIENMLIEIFECLWMKKKELEKLDDEDRADADFESHDY